MEDVEVAADPWMTLHQNARNPPDRQARVEGGEKIVGQIGFAAP
jgi:hypothetical protein